MPRLRLSRAVFGLVLVVFAVPPALRSEATLTPQELVRHVSLHEAASVRLQAAGRTVYFDPFFDGKVVAPPADLIVITHDDARHCSDRTVARILEPDTTLIAPEGCRRMLSGVAKNTVTLAAPGVVTKVGEITVEAVPAYTPHHPDHARERGGVGYVVTLGGVRIYYSGSTELVPELQAVRADVAVLAFWEGYVMSTEEAAELARSLQAKVVVPTHCKPEEALKLRDLLGGAAHVELMAPR
jgi:L-ascorbate metabolism protein UlaG (beta-lactamase superfamily)